MAFDTLLIAASFFGYAAEIRRELERRGRSVLWFEDRPALDMMTKGMVRVAPVFAAAKTQAHAARILAAVQGQPIRDVLVIKGEGIGVGAVAQLRAALPGARFTLYFWDSYLNMPRASRQKVTLFDRTLTFDPRDAAADLRLRYRPLFFLPAFSAAAPVEPDIDVLFVGTLHSDRHLVLRRLKRAMPANVSFEQILFVRSRGYHRVRSLVDPAYRRGSGGRFAFTPLPKTEVAALVARSRILVDVERPIQAGFTMRTIEALGAGKKLITTNPHVAHADFYHPSRFAVINRKAPVLDADFLFAPEEPMPPELLRRYTLAAWVDDVLPEPDRATPAHNRELCNAA